VTDAYVLAVGNPRLDFAEFTVGSHVRRFVRHQALLAQFPSELLEGLIQSLHISGDEGAPAGRLTKLLQGLPQLHLRPGPIPMEPDPGKLSTLFPPSLDRQIYVCGAAIIVLGRIISKIYATGDQVYNCSSPFVNELKLSSEAESRKGIFSCAIENRSV
jgi:hypothetical protein